MKKQTILSLLLSIICSLCILIMYVSCEPPATTPDPTDTPTEEPTDAPTATPTDEPTATPTEEPTPEPIKGAGDVWIDPADQTVGIGEIFTTDIYINSGTQKIAAYGIDISYNIFVLSVDAVDEGADGYISALNINTLEGIIITSGFDTSGEGPGENLHLLTIDWTAISTGTSVLEITVKKLVDEETEIVGVPTGINGSVTVE